MWRLFTALLKTLEQKMIAMSFLRKKPPMVATAVRLTRSSCIGNKWQIYLRKRDIIINIKFQAQLSFKQKFQIDV